MQKKIKKRSLYKMLWPIESSELSKFLPMAILMFFLLFNQNLIRSAKDSFIITTIGSEIISFIKIWGEIPISMLFVLGYTKLCGITSTEKIFRVTLVCFLCFFYFFAFIFFPNQNLFHPSSETVKYYVDSSPHLKWFFIMWGKWGFVLFYIVCELWPIVAFSLFFWQLANKITTPSEAKKFYVFFNLFGQSNLLISGRVIIYLTQTDNILSSFFSNIDDQNTVIIKSITVLSICSGIVCFFLHKWIERNHILTQKDIVYKKHGNDILTLSVKESIKHTMKSKQLAMICILVICYGISVILIEGIWMSRTRALYPLTQDFLAYQGNVLFYTGFFTLICTFIGGNIVNILGWFWGAILIPIVVLIAGTMFFTSVIIEEHLDFLLLGLSNLSPLFIVVFIGGVQNVLCKGVKYSLFDATKEMLYIPLSKELKIRGKAAVDVVGMKVGKLIGSSIQAIAFIIFPTASHEDIVWLLMSCFIITCLIWSYNVIKLKDLYKNCKSIFEK